MQTGQNVHDPLTQLNSHMGFGAMAGLNPFGEMGLNPNDPNMVRASFFLGVEAPRVTALCLPLPLNAIAYSFLIDANNDEFACFPPTNVRDDV